MRVQIFLMTVIFSLMGCILKAENICIDAGNPVVEYFHSLDKNEIERILLDLNSDEYPFPHLPRLVQAAQLGLPKVVRHIQKMSPGEYLKYSGEALYHAAGVGDVEIVKQLLLSGVNPNFQVDASHGTALVAAFNYGYLEVAQTLIAYGADVNFLFRGKISLGELAVATGNDCMLELLDNQ